ELRTFLRRYSGNGGRPVGSTEGSKSGDEAFQNGIYFDQSISPIGANLVDFMSEFRRIYADCNRFHQQVGGRPQVAEMRSFEQSQKSKKTVASMIIQSKNMPAKQQPQKKQSEPEPEINGESDNSKLLPAKELYLKKMSTFSSSPKAKKKAGASQPKKKSKKPTVWEFGGKSDPNLDFSKKDEETTNGQMSSSVARNLISSDVNSKDIDMQPDLDFETEESE